MEGHDTSHESRLRDDPAERKRERRVKNHFRKQIERFVGVIEENFVCGIDDFEEFCI